MIIDFLLCPFFSKDRIDEFFFFARLAYDLTIPVAFALQ
jgi:hypothetical protein